MAVMVEKRFGRRALIQCMLDRRLLLVRYNQAAEELNKMSEAVSDWAILAVHLGPPLSLLSRISERSSP